MVFLSGYSWKAITEGNKRNNCSIRSSRKNWVIDNGGTMEFCQRVAACALDETDLEDDAELGEWEFYDPGTVPSTEGTIVHGSTLFEDYYDEEDDDDEVDEVGEETIVVGNS